MTPSTTVFAAVADPVAPVEPTFPAAAAVDPDAETPLLMLA